MSDDIGPQDRFLEHAATAVVEASPRHGLAAQPALPDLDNHVRVRHASALMAAAYAASRALVGAALATHADRSEAVLADVEIAYKRMAVGPLTAKASPGCEGWEALVAQAAAGEGATLPTAAAVVDAEDRVVAEATLSWAVRPAESASA